MVVPLDFEPVWLLVWRNHQQSRCCPVLAQSGQHPRRREAGQLISTAGVSNGASY